MAGEVNNIIRIPTSLNTSFFRFWVEFLRPLHNLTGREMQVAASLLKRRYELGKVIQDDDILDKVLMSEDTRREIRAECNLSLPHFQGIMSKLRKSGIIIDNRLNMKFLPRVSENQGSFRLLLNFELD